MRGIGGPRAENFFGPVELVPASAIQRHFPQCPRNFGLVSVIDLLFRHWDDLDPGLMRRLEPLGLLIIDNPSNLARTPQLGAR
jgi:hypothetical protein